MRIPSLTLVLSTSFLAYIVYSVWSLSRLFVIPSCQQNESCLYYYLQQKPALQMVSFISSNSRVTHTSNVQLVEVVKDFDYNSKFERNWQITVPDSTKRNGTLFLHMFVLPKSHKVENLRDAFSVSQSSYSQVSLSHYQLPSSGTYQLLTGKNPGSLQKPVTHLKNSVKFSILTGITTIPRNSVPIELFERLRWSSGDVFLPIVYFNPLNDRLRNLVEITSNSSTMNVTFYYEPISIGKLRFMFHIESAFTTLRTLGFNDKDLDEIKGVFADTHIYFLMATVFISSIHLLFDFLALKNDVSFWRSRRTMEGLSGRTVIWRAFSQVIIFLYLLDEDTSLLVLGPAFLSAILEFWKVQKIVQVDWRRLKFKETKFSDAEKKTQEFDAESMHYLSFVLYPLCIAAAAYSLLYETHRSWYSWCIHSLVNGVYAFGFLFMLPQLFINYRLKSVAHLPWRAFMYKAFNTFIDDIFAFIITMPTAHRLACFRDDVIFLIYLYQRWLYPVDKNRVDYAMSIDEHFDSPEEKKKK